ncbi:MAG: phenylacetate--CoA ligase family protein, partial [Peptococcaceae bacterium]|nr:phenylacetate--CoA ligase family protein [Peptococcaceae bacterium]
MNRSHIDDYIMAVEGLRTLDRQNLEALQLQKLNAMLQRMRAHGETQLPTRVETLEALAALPFTTAKDLAEKPSQFLLTSQGEIARIITDRTSGTTAAAKRVFYTEKDVQNTIDFFAAGISEMAQPGEAVLITMPFSGALGLGDLIQKAVEKIGARPLCAGWGKSYDELSALVRAEKPRSYIGFPVPLLSLARYMG